MAEQLLVKMEKISKSFGHVRALQDVDLELYHGEILGLVGDNAAGKSTLMKILSGAYTPDSGRIFFEGEEVRLNDPGQARALGIEMVYQNFALVPTASIFSNIFMGREKVCSFLSGLVKILDRATMERESWQALSQIGARFNSMKDRVRELSGGQQQAVAIARATYFNPKVLIMDEPTASLAVNQVNRLLDWIVKLKERGISIIFTSHRLQDVFSIGDRVMVLRRGRRVGERKIAETTMNEVIELMTVGYHISGQAVTPP
ncbi:MAG: ATP-binding cassette domain-containing protein [Anaerolineae bacterium]